MNRIVLILAGLYFTTSAFAQNVANEKIEDDSLSLANIKEDTERINMMRVMAEYYNLNNRNDSSLLLVTQALELSNKINFEKGKIISLFTMGKIFVHMGNYTRGLELYLQSLQVSERVENTEWQVYNLNYIGEVYGYNLDYRQALRYYFKGKAIAEQKGLTAVLAKIMMNIGKTYESMGNTDSASFYILKSYDIIQQNNNDDYLPGKVLYSLGALYAKKGDGVKAMEFYRLGFMASKNVEDYPISANASLGIADLFYKIKNTDSTLYYARQSLAIAKNAGFIQQQLNAVSFLAKYFKEAKVFDSAYAYMSGTIALKDSLISAEKIREFEKVTFSEDYRQQEIKQAQLRYDNRVKMIILSSILVILVAVALVLWRNVWNKQRANRLLTAQKQEIDKQKDEIENSYKELKLTQAQLIQSEKMASLGELTAGIAHEIQNPLNFVNNFSEVSAELLKEMVDEINKGNIEEVKPIAHDLVQNLEKINHHGKRADGIVKGMLQHSRSSTGQKEPTDINMLADEYLRLAYHGLRAKDKTFNAHMHTDFDQNIGMINIIPQDIGRVILNLITNAFYAVTEKKNKSVPGTYEPTVTVSTKKLKEKIEIRVKDNGQGIPQKVLDKIFQPFFTTKPTGEGTGLGLSLSYDIIKAHGGELRAETKEGEFAEFIITLQP